MGSDEATGATMYGGSPRTSSGAPSHKSPLGRLARAAAVLASVGVVVLTAGSYAAANHVTGNLQRLDGLFAPTQARPPASIAGSKNFLLVGSDSRDGLTRAERAKYHLGQDVGRRSDTMIILHISEQHDRALLISLPRDSYVELPEYTDDAGHAHQAQHAKLNAAYSYGGAKLTIATVEKATGIRIDHYVEINVAGFARMVDALGGVEVCLNSAVNDPKSGLHLPAGRSVVHGTAGLAFVRARKTIGDGSDLGRIKRQQLFLGSMLRKAMSTGVLINPAKLNRFLTAATRSVQVDRDLSFADLRVLADTMSNLSPSHVTFVTVPLSDTNYRPGNLGSTVLWDPDLSTRLFDAVRDDIDINAADVKEPTGLLAPSAVSVLVLNGTTTKGLAGQASSDLTSAGFKVGTPDNADRPTYESTEIHYAPGDQRAARTVQAAIAGSVLKSDPGAGSTVVVTLGANYRGVQRVPTPAVTPTHSSPAIERTTAAERVCAG